MVRRYCQELGINPRQPSLDSILYSEMKALTKTLLLVLIAFAGKSQQREFIIKDIFPTQTSTAIHSHFIIPFKMDFKVEKRQYKHNYRPSYIYHLAPHSKELKKYKIRMEIWFSDTSDSSAIHWLVGDDYKRIEGKDYLFYNEENLLTFKSGVFIGQSYNFVLLVKHNQNKESFDINKLLWFVDIAKSWRLEHGNHH